MSHSTCTGASNYCVSLYSAHCLCDKSYTCICSNSPVFEFAIQWYQTPKSERNQMKDIKSNDWGRVRIKLPDIHSTFTIQNAFFFWNCAFFFQIKFIALFEHLYAAKNMHHLIHQKRTNELSSALCLQFMCLLCICMCQNGMKMKAFFVVILIRISSFVVCSCFSQTLRLNRLHFCW